MAPPTWSPTRLVASHGAHSLSAQAAHAGVRVWRPNDGVGFVAYVHSLGTWLAVGPPVGPSGQAAALVQAFVAAAAQAGFAAVFFGLGPALAQAAGLRWLACGQEPLWRAGAWAQGPGRQSCWRQVRRARRLGVVVGPLPEAQSPQGAPAYPYGSALDDVLLRWQAGQNLPPLGFVARASLRQEVPGALRLLAQVHDVPVAVAVVLPDAPAGVWLIEQLIRAPQAPNGTIELLVDHAMRRIATQAPHSWVSMGLVALAGELCWPLRLARTLGGGLYPFAGLQAFRHKLAPEVVTRVGLAYPAGTGATRAMASLLLAFAEPSPVRFAWSWLRRGPRLAKN